MVTSRRKARQKAKLDLRSIGRRIRELCGFDMTQQEFARRIGVAQSHLSALEHGEREPGSSVLLAISREFGRSVDWLLTGRKGVVISPPTSASIYDAASFRM